MYFIKFIAKYTYIQSPPLNFCQCFKEEGDLLGVTLIGGIICTALWEM